MKIINGISVPETLHEASLLSYKQLEAAAEVFNYSGPPLDEAMKLLDNQWVKGFDAAYEFIMNIMAKSSYASEDIYRKVEHEVSLHKKNNYGRK